MFFKNLLLELQKCIIPLCVNIMSREMIIQFIVVSTTLVKDPSRTKKKKKKKLFVLTEVLSKTCCPF